MSPLSCALLHALVACAPRKRKLTKNVSVAAAAAVIFCGGLLFEFWSATKLETRQQERSGGRPRRSPKLAWDNSRHTDKSWALESRPVSFLVQVGAECQSVRVWRKILPLWQLDKWFVSRARQEPSSIIRQATTSSRKHACLYY